MVAPLASYPAAIGIADRLLDVAACRGLDTILLEHAIDVAAVAHAGQRRRSGEPYICHPLEVATLVADVGADTASVAAAILHDTVEDTSLELIDITEQFGAEVAALVDGCTKVAKVRAGGDEDTIAAQRLRKLFVALAADPRVVIVKLADRLHNLRTIAALPEAKAARIGRETLAVHAPLAHRLGLAIWKAELEDRAFAVAYPNEYAEVAAALDEIPDLADRLELAVYYLRDILHEGGIAAEVSGRIKHLWSTRSKSTRAAVTPADLHDLVAVRAIVASEQDCYATLAMVHSTFEPVPGRLKDYISSPKFNRYQSLHTTVLLAGQLVEVQIRTAAMHEAAERGVASHSAYKHGADPAWLHRLLAWSADDDDFLEGVHAELAAREITVLSPGGDVYALPEGAGVIDFAYAIHTDVGNRCSGALVDGRLVPLSTRLHSGQTVQIQTRRDSGPSLDWLDWTVTAHARRTIKRWFTRQWRTDAINRGNERLTRILANSPFTLDDLVAAAGLRDAEQLFEQVGRGTLDPARVIDRSRRRTTPIHARPQLRTSDAAPALEGLPGSAVRLAGCCTPAPGTAIAALATRGVLPVHTMACTHLQRALADTPGRVLRAAWVSPGEELLVHQVHADDTPGIRSALSSAVTGAGARATAIRRLDRDTWQIVSAAPAQRARVIATTIASLPNVRSVRGT